MRITQTKLEGCFVIEPKILEDKRGYFFESFNQNQFNKETNTNINFVQDNESFSTKGVLRGLHYQRGIHAQAKLVRVVKGRVLDIAVDVRKVSPTFGQYVAMELTEDNKKQIFIPQGFAHGFIVLSDSAILVYKCDNVYNKEAEGGIIYNDPTLNIDWQLPEKSLIVSEKDVVLPKLVDAKL